MRFNLFLGFLLLINWLYGQQKVLLDSTVRFDFIGGDSLPALKNLYRYENKGRLIEKTEQNSSLTTGLWQPQNRETYHYYGDGLQIDTQMVWKAVDLQWIPVSRTINHLDGNELRETLEQEWNDSLEIWENNGRTLFGNSTGNTSYTVGFRWETSSLNWQPLDSLVRIFTAGKGIVSDTIYTWINPAQIYVISAATDYQYDSLDQLLVRTRYNFDFEQSIFKPRSRDTFDYDEKGFQILSQFDIWLAPLQIWEPSLRIERESNADGRLEQSSLFFYDFVSGQLRPSSRLEYRYTDGTARTEEDSLILSVKNFVYQGPFEVPDYVRHYYYAVDATTAAYHLPNALIEFYPNPARGELRIRGDWSQFTDYQWYTPEGKMIRQGPLRQDMIEVPGTARGPVLLILRSRSRHIQPLAKIILID